MHDPVNVQGAEAAQCEAALSLADLFQRAPGFMAVLRGPQLVFEVANTAFLDLVGNRNILGKPLLAILPEVAEQEIAALNGVIATGEPCVGADKKILLQRHTGVPAELRYVDFVYQPLLATDGTVSGVFVEGSDVTERHVAEEALREAGRRKDEFLATLAHELRNPLSPIRHAAKLAQKASVTPKQLKWSHEVIERQVKHMSRLLDDLLDVSRITRGKFELQTQCVALADCVAEAMESGRPLIEAKQHHVEVDLPVGEPVYVDGDPVRLVQIFSNLITNAAKYTDSGGRLVVTMRTAGDSVEVSVLDNGMGISAEVLPQVFDMFAQATSALDRTEGGLGIGLSLVRGLVRLHGGSVEAHSQGPGTGSEFVVRLPRSGRRTRAEGAVAATPVFRGHRKLRILVADDNRDSADTCKQLLDSAGHSVRAAYGGNEALDVAGRFHPEVAVLDIGMPGMNGYEVASRIRDTQWGAEATLIAATGWGQDADKRRAIDAGFDHHLTKPIDLDTLAALLEERSNRLSPG